ncbi:MAG TPA: YceI family protein, partial [Rhizomicrobium sp.]
MLFSVSHMGFTTYYGDFTGVSGSLEFEPKAPVTSTLSVTIPVDSVTTTNAKLDGELKSNQWLDSTAFPTATFKSTKVVVTGHDQGQVTGELTLHGVTKTETFAVKFNGGGLNPLSKKYTV